MRLNRSVNEVVFFYRRSRTAILADLIQHFEPGWFGGWRGLVARLDFLTAQRLTVPRKFRTSFTDRGTAREAVQRIMAWPAEAVLAAHCPPLPQGGRAAIAHAFAWLLRRKKGLERRPR